MSSMRSTLPKIIKRPEASLANTNKYEVQGHWESNERQRPSNVDTNKERGPIGKIERRVEKD